MLNCLGNASAVLWSVSPCLYWLSSTLKLRIRLSPQMHNSSCLNTLSIAAFKDLCSFLWANNVPSQESHVTADLFHWFDCHCTNTLPARRGLTTELKTPVQPVCCLTTPLVQDFWIAQYFNDVSMKLELWVDIKIWPGRPRRFSCDVIGWFRYA